MTSASNDESLAGVVPVVRAILRRKTGMSLAEDDARRDNIDAIALSRQDRQRLGVARSLTRIVNR